jgi:hypothetical protein
VVTARAHRHRLLQERRDPERVDGAAGPALATAGQDGDEVRGRPGERIGQHHAAVVDIDQIPLVQLRNGGGIERSQIHRAPIGHEAIEYDAQRGPRSRPEPRAIQPAGIEGGVHQLGRGLHGERRGHGL